MHQYGYDFDGQYVTRTKEEKTWWQATKDACAKAVDDVKKAPLRKQALNAIADHALQHVYEEQAQAKRDKSAAKNTAKAEKAAAKAAASKSKLEQVVEATTAQA